MYEHNALGYWSGLALCLTKVRSSRARCPATALIFYVFIKIHVYTNSKICITYYRIKGLCQSFKMRPVSVV